MAGSEGKSSLCKFMFGGVNSLPSATRVTISSVLGL